ncbi:MULTISPECIES: serine/threonine-protein kinase [Nocardiopsis]|uniref:serine/threonine-protein kinase n=1 Tax=Nocardiopsis TaxID=2013 RepID=UPI001F1A28A6|nr:MULTISPECIES: serine/threonine-protein kinase [Nocardiopsis]
MHPEYASADDFRARFAREVDLLDRVGGACAVPLLEADTDAARPWLANPLVRGMTLSEHLRKHGPLNGELLRGLAVGVAEALAHIHEAGIAHRDLKPSNIILSPEGPRVLDFGVARAVDQTAITRTGMLSGSPGWISPEHCRGEPVSTADDVFAWGALVAYAATGRPPFGSGNAAAVAHRVLNTPPDTDGFSGPLADLSLRALSKQAAERPTALELVHGVVQAASPGRAIAPVRDVGTAAAATAGLLDRDWHGVRTGAEREYEIPAVGGGGPDGSWPVPGPPSGPWSSWRGSSWAVWPSAGTGSTCPWPRGSRPARSPNPPRGSPWRRSAAFPGRSPRRSRPRSPRRNRPKSPRRSRPRNPTRSRRRRSGRRSPRRSPNPRPRRNR